MAVGLPQDHEDQLQLGIRIVTSAFQNRMNSLEQEIRAVKLTYDEHKNNVVVLQKKNSQLETELVSTHQTSHQLSEENKELFKTVGALRKQVARLEGLKSAVMSSMQDDQAAEAELGDHKHLTNDGFLAAKTPLTFTEMGHTGHTKALTASASRDIAFDHPKTDSHIASPRPPSLAGGGGQASPSPVLDGKAFFRQARSRLSYEAFNLFLTSIKRLNNQQQTREETLDEARRIFGPELQDLYLDFETLLNRHGM